MLGWRCSLYRAGNEIPKEDSGKKRAFMPDLYVQRMPFVSSLRMKGARVASLVMHWLGKRRVLVCMLERSLRYRAKDPTRPLTEVSAHCSGHTIRLRFNKSKSPGTFHPPNSSPAWIEVLGIESGTLPSISNTADINSNYRWQPTAAGQTG